MLWDEPFFMPQTNPILKVELSLRIGLEGTKAVQASEPFYIDTTMWPKYMLPMKVLEIVPEVPEGHILNAQGPIRIKDAPPCKPNPYHSKHPSWDYYACTMQWCPFRGTEKYYLSWDKWHNCGHNDHPNKVHHTVCCPYGYLSTSEAVEHLEKLALKDEEEYLEKTKPKAHKNCVGCEECVPQAAVASMKMDVAALLA
jgi:hypothetical protein